MHKPTAKRPTFFHHVKPGIRGGILPHHSTTPTLPLSFRKVVEVVGRCGRQKAGVCMSPRHGMEVSQMPGPPHHQPRPPGRLPGPSPKGSKANGPKCGKGGKGQKMG